MKKTICVIVKICLLYFCSAYSETIQVGNTSREMIVHAPGNVAANSPLVISLHGMNQSASYQQSTTHWDAVSDTAGFVVVYPEAINAIWDISGSSDLNFIIAVISEMNSRYSIDLRRVYLSGFSMGGMLTYHAMNNIADQIAAFGPVSGYMTTDILSSRPIPIMHVHGTADDVVPYAAGNSGMTGAYFPGIQSITEGWAGRANCSTPPLTQTPYPASTSNSNSKMVYSGCANGLEVQLISLAGKGHWHSDDPAGVYTTTELWNFFKRYSLGGSAPVLTSAANISIPDRISDAGLLTSDNDGAVFEISRGADALLFNISGSVLSFISAPSYASPEDADNNNIYEITLQVSANGESSETQMYITVLPPRGPYGGAAAVIPGVIEFENFDVGGNGYAYYDDSPGSETGVNYRAEEDVDIEEKSGGGYNIGWATAGEWLEYTVNVSVSGTYNIDLDVACNGDDRTINLDIDGNTLASNISIPNTGDWQSWQIKTVEGVALEAGERIVRMTVGPQSYVNLNSMNFSLSNPVRNLRNSTKPPPLIMHTADGFSLHGVSSAAYRLYDLHGTQLETGIAVEGQLWGQNLTAGIYVVAIQSEYGEFIRNIVKQ
jgi:poly(3-hydroxybutyrate) depolymerase